MTDIDNFYLTTTARPWIALVDRTHYGDHVHGIVHGHDHKLNGTKMWTWGQNQITDWTQTLRADALGSGWGGCFTEQQTGVKNTQSQRFFIGPGSTYEFTEYFKALEGLGSHPSTLYAPNYTAAVGAVQDFLDSPRGVNATVFARVDAWLAGYSDHALLSGDVLHPVSVRAHVLNSPNGGRCMGLRASPHVLYCGPAWGRARARARARARTCACDGARTIQKHNLTRHFFMATLLPLFLRHQGQPWGALEAAAGARMPKSTHFVASKPAEARAWWELLSPRGTFGNASLAASTVLSFATSPRWQGLIRASAAKHGATWLHELHLSIAVADAGDFAAAVRHGRASVALKPTALGYRNLAVLGPAATRFDSYGRAWQVALASGGAAAGDAPGKASAGLQFRRNLASEITQAMLADGNMTRLGAFVKALETDYEREADLVVKARVAVAIADGETAAARALLATHAFPTMSCYRDDVVGLWDLAWWADEEARLKRPLTTVEKHRVRKAHPPLPQFGARPEWPNAGGRKAV